MRAPKHDFQLLSGVKEGTNRQRDDENISGSSDAIRIIIIIRQPIIRHGLSAIISAQPDLDVVATAANCAQCCRQASGLELDILLCDLETEGNCVAGEITGKFQKALPDLPTIVMHEDVQGRRVMGASRLGVQGFLTMDTKPENLFQAIRVVAGGGTYVDERLHSMVMDLVRGKNKNDLNQRELEILQLLSEGKSNQEIADTLFVSKGTVKHYVSMILTKIGASNRTEAVRKAVLLDLL